MGYGLPSYDGSEFRFVTCEEALRLQDAGRALVVDVRDLQDTGAARGWASGHVQAAVSLPSGELMFAPKDAEPKVAALLARLTAEPTTVAVVCSNTGAAGGPFAGRCLYVAGFLRERGVPAEQVARLEGGVNAWRSLGFPME